MSPSIFTLSAINDIKTKFIACKGNYFSQNMNNVFNQFCQKIRTFAL